MSAFVVEHDSGSTRIAHLDGISWFDAPLPRRLHRCKVQTAGLINYFTPVNRCACGAVQYDGGWIERNSRRKGQK